MLRIFALTIILFLLAVACSSGDQNAQLGPPVIPFVVRADETTVVYDIADGRQTVSLPPGRVTADERTHVSLEADGHLQIFDVLSGSQTAQFAVEGDWQLAVVSPNGRWVVLQRAGGRTTAFQVLDVGTGQVRHELTLDGRFVAEAIANSGQALYLIEHVDDTRYRVRLYDLGGGRLADEPLRDKRSTDELMTGYAWGSVQSADGAWLLTLYLNSERNAAFIHALNLNNSATFCLDLPSDGDFATLSSYTLINHRSKVYAVNAELGVLATYDLSNLGDAAVQQFTPIARSDGDSATRAGTVSRDGRRIAFAHGTTYWYSDTINGRLARAEQSATPIVDLAFSADGGQLYIAWADGPPGAVALPNAQLFAPPTSLVAGR